MKIIFFLSFILLQFQTNLFANQFKMFHSPENEIEKRLEKILYTYDSISNNIKNEKYQEIFTTELIEALQDHEDNFATINNYYTSYHSKCDKACKKNNINAILCDSNLREMLYYIYQDDGGMIYIQTIDVINTGNVIPNKYILKKENNIFKLHSIECCSSPKNCSLNKLKKTKKKKKNK